MSDEWVTEAACTGKPTEMFYDDIWRQGHTNLEALDQARSVCQTCSVRRECLAYVMAYENGLSVKSRGGVWGGLTPAQRRSLDVRQAPPHCECGRAFDPLQWLGRVLVCDQCGRRTAVSPLPDEGDQWDDRHTELALRIIESFNLHVAGDTVAHPKTMAAYLDSPIAEVRRVYHELVLTGVLQLEVASSKRKHYRLIALPEGDWAPKHKQAPC